MNIWLRGLLAALITGASGGASTALSSLVIPELMQNPALLWKVAVWSAITGALIGVLSYLKQSPLPPA